MNLSLVPAEVDRIVFPVSIYEAEGRRQNFGQVRNAFIRVINQADDAELARYDLSEDASSETAMIFGELYRTPGTGNSGRSARVTPRGWPASRVTTASTSADAGAAHHRLRAAPPPRPTREIAKLLCC